MTEAINAHKKMAMGMTEGNVMKKGGAVKRYAMGGAVNKGAIPESRVANLPAVAVTPKIGKPTGKIATMKRGGAARGR
jgi:hypothetical protein